MRFFRNSSFLFQNSFVNLQKDPRYISMPKLKYMPIAFYPDLIKDWDFKKNEKNSPYELTAGSSKKVWWKCSVCGEEKEMSPNSRMKGSCRSCDAKRRIEKLIAEKGSFESNYPEKALDWDKEENGGLLPSQVTAGSNITINWKCHVCGYQWKGKVCNHAKSLYSCEKCAIRETTLKRYGSAALAETHPDLAKEWNYSRNSNLTPYDVTPHDTREVYWICRKGHEWQAPIGYRVRTGAQCPKCISERKTSFPEQAIFYYLSKVTKAKNRRKIGSHEIDILLKDLKIGIEYDGYYHSSLKAMEREERKNEGVAKKGYRLIRVKEANRNQIDGDIIYTKYRSDYSNLDFVIHSLLNLIGKTNEIEVNIEKDRMDICDLFIQSEKADSIKVKMSELAEQWDYEQNGNTRPEYIRITSSKKFWWRCSNGHSWPATVYQRAAGSGCPYCAGHILIVGENDLLSQDPILAEEWDYELNEGQKPNEITANNNKAVWWKCPKCNHRWQTSVANRNKGGTGCPKCAKLERTKTRYKTIIEKNGSFADNFPELLKEWDYDKNNGITPNELTPFCTIKVWWKCSKGHSWPATIANRAKGRGCKECYRMNNPSHQRQYAVNKSGSFCNTHSHLLKDWDYEKNTEKPEEFSVGSRCKAYWRCHNCGHEWQVSIFKRTGGHKCPSCHK